MYLPSSVTAEITEHFEPHLSRRPTDFICVYGSSVSSPNKPTSDVDMFAVTTAVGSLGLEGIIGFVKGLHERHGRELDEEVPFENKVLYTTREVDDALCFSGLDTTGDCIEVPPIQKEAGFLASPEIKARLAFNALTTPHEIIGYDLSEYRRVRVLAIQAATVLGIALGGHDEFSAQSLLHTLTQGPTGEEGEMYLGYKTVSYPLVEQHLLDLLATGLDILDHNEAIKPTAAGYTRTSAFNPVRYMQNQTALQQ